MLLLIKIHMYSEYIHNFLLRSNVHTNWTPTSIATILMSTRVFNITFQPATRLQFTSGLDDCPICYEPIQHSCWKYSESRWDTDYISGTIRTLCNHHFCGTCWGKLKPSSGRHYDEPIVKKCPMCRQENTDVDTWS